jgi:crossover junction endodeoxyribonuclease RusA
MQARLPYPPTINHYYGTDPRTGHKYLTKRARTFRKTVWALLVGCEKMGSAEVAVLIDVYPPRNVGDIDNTVKPLLDALEHAQVFDNDKQVVDLRIRLNHMLCGGAVDVKIWRINDVCDRGESRTERNQDEDGPGRRPVPAHGRAQATGSER